MACTDCGTQQEQCNCSPAGGDQASPDLFMEFLKGLHGPGSYPAATSERTASPAVPPTPGPSATAVLSAFGGAFQHRGPVPPEAASPPPEPVKAVPPPAAPPVVLPRPVTAGARPSWSRLSPSAAAAPASVAAFYIVGFGGTAVWRLFVH